MSSKKGSKLFKGSFLVIGCDSKYGFMRMRLSQGSLDEALAIYKTGEGYCGMGPRSRLYTVGEMTVLLESAGCDIFAVASTPTFSDTIDKSMYTSNPKKWEQLKVLELEVCRTPELLGMGLHLLFCSQEEVSCSVGKADNYLFNGKIVGFHTRIPEVRNLWI